VLKQENYSQDEIDQHIKAKAIELVEKEMFVRGMFRRTAALNPNSK